MAETRIHGILVRDDLTPGLRRAVSRMEDTVSLELRRAAQEIATSAAAAAPVVTGAFRRAIKVVEKTGPSSVQAGVSVDVEYATHVRTHKGKPSAGDPAWKVLIERPMQRASEAVARRIARRIADQVEG